MHSSALCHAGSHIYVNIILIGYLQSLSYDAKFDINGSIASLKLRTGDLHENLIT